MSSVDLFPGQWQPQVVLMAALEVGLIEALLDRPQPPAEVAQKLGLDERAEWRWSARRGCSAPSATPTPGTCGTVDSWPARSSSDR
jgi:hypothetical protein